MVAGLPRDAHTAASDASPAQAAGWDEVRRSAALHAYGALDTPREAEFDEIAAIASEVCETPIAVVNLVDTHRQFFKAEVGLGVRETPLATSFCGHTILAEELMIVPDAREDPRFVDNPLVAGEPGLRFYAGVLLRTPEGLPIGTLCVLDYAPRTLDARQVRMLRFLARQAMAQLELRRALDEQTRSLEAARETEREKSILARVVEQASDSITMAGPNGRVFFANDAARRLAGLGAGPLPLASLADFVAEPDRAAFRDAVMPALAEHGSWEGELRLGSFGSGADVPALFGIFPLRDAAGRLAGYGTVAKDITPQREEQRRRADLTREMSHRMKNTLALAQSIVSQTFRNTTTIEEGKEAIAGRLSALAAAQSALTGEHGPASAADVVAGALAPHRTGEGRFSAEGPPIELGAPQVLGLSLAVHELATNAAKYGALSGPAGQVRITWSAPAPGRFRFEWVEAGGPPVAPPTRKGFGSRLVERIVAPYFEGEARLEFAREGLRFRLEGRQRPEGDGGA